MVIPNQTSNNASEHQIEERKRERIQRDLLGSSMSILGAAELARHEHLRDCNLRECLV